MSDDVYKISCELYNSVNMQHFIMRIGWTVSIDSGYNILSLSENIKNEIVFNYSTSTIQLTYYICVDGCMRSFWWLHSVLWAAC